MPVDVDYESCGKLVQEFRQRLGHPAKAIGEHRGRWYHLCKRDTVRHQGPAPPSESARRAHELWPASEPDDTLSDQCQYALEGRWRSTEPFHANQYKSNFVDWNFFLLKSIKV